jgi:pilus assembly protein CpaF
MISMAGLDLPPRAVRSQIASAIGVVVQLKRFSDGTRRVVSVQEIEGMEGDVIIMQEVFRYDQTGVGEQGKVLGRFVGTGLRPRFLEAFRANGVTLPEGVFA